MRLLAGEIAWAIVLDCGIAGFLERLSEPTWFQALGCVLGFDWHSSGLTTTTCGAIKEGIRGSEEELGLFVAGGKEPLRERLLRRLPFRENAQGSTLAR